MPSDIVRQVQSQQKGYQLPSRQLIEMQGVTVEPTLQLL